MDFALIKPADVKPQTFDSLRIGSLFRKDKGPIFIRVEPVDGSDCPANAVNLSFGTWSNFQSFEEVQEVVGTLHYRELTPHG